MSVYKRYNTRRKRIPKGFFIAATIVIAVFALTALLGHHLAQKAADGEVLYTGTLGVGEGGSNLAPLLEKSLHGEYVAPKDIAKFTTEDDNVWASTWIYKDGKATFATATDKLLGNEPKLPDVSTLNIEAGSIGLFEVKSIYADEQVKGILTEYELSLLGEFAAAGLDEVVLVFNDVTEENADAVFEFAEKFTGAKVLCVPYSMLGNDAFFSEAASKQLSLAVKADGVSPQKLEEDINTYAFYFTRYNLRLVLDGKDSALIDVLAKNTLLNYQFTSPKEEKK